MYAFFTSISLNQPEMGKGPVGRWGVVLEIFTVGGDKIFFDPFYDILVIFLQIL